VKKLLSAAIAALVLPLSLGATPAGAFQLKLFHTPDGNIGCEMSFGKGSYGGGARCDIAEHDWKTPKKPASCDVDYGGGLGVGASGKGAFVCAGDTTLHQGRKLATGGSISVGPYKCKNLGDTMRCVNRDTGHGFELSRSKAKRF
jgi:hypothetical protein